VRLRTVSLPRLCGARSAPYYYCYVYIETLSVRKARATECRHG